MWFNAAPAQSGGCGFGFELLENASESRAIGGRVHGQATARVLRGGLRAQLIPWNGLASRRICGGRECRSCRDAERTEQGEVKPGEAMHFVTKQTHSSTSKLHKRPR